MRCRPDCWLSLRDSLSVSGRAFRTRDSQSECQSRSDVTYGSRMNRFFWGNFDFEEQLRGDVQRSSRVERLVLELASCWLAVADADDRIWCPGELPFEFLESLAQWELPSNLFVSDPRQIPHGMELVPWGWSPAAVEFGERQRLIVNAPPLDVVCLANSREYSVPLEESPADDWDYATLCRTLGQVLACVERLPHMTAWVIKANWSHAARERILGRGSQLTAADISWVKQRLARDGVVSWERWLNRESEVGIQWHITPGQAPELIAITELLVDPRGQYAGTREMSLAVSTPEWAMQAAESTRPAVHDLANRGYFGPVGIDAMRYTHPDWNMARTRPLQDINARWTMGRLAAGWFERIQSERPVTWWHGNRDSDVTAEWIATSPDTINRAPVSHRTWLT